jgi:hypothetical protein
MTSHYSIANSTVAEVSRRLQEMADAGARGPLDMPYHQIGINYWYTMGFYD